MGWTKRQFIDRALSEIGLGKRSYTPTNEDYTDALAIADSMVESWHGRVGLGIGWPVTDNPDDSNIDSETEVPLIYNEAVALQLAIRLAPGYGKQVMPDTKVNASQSFKTMIAKLSPPKPKQQPQGVPLGGGNRWRGRIFTPAPEETSDLVSGDNTIESL